MQLKKFFAKLVLKTAQGAGSGGLKIARRILPVWVKLKLSRLIAENVSMSEAPVIASNGLRFYPIKETVFLQVRMEGYYEKAISDITEKFIRRGDIVVDVGANFGWYTMLMCSAVGDVGKVFSFEPNRKMFEVLSKNIALNAFENRVLAKQIGIGEAKGVALLRATEGEYGLGHVLNAEDISDENSYNTQEIAIESLDDLFVNEVGNIAFIKIDVEGFEPFVFFGGQKILESQNPPILQVEFNADALRLRGTDVVDQFVEYLNKMNAQIYAGQSGKLVRKNVISSDENNDLFIIPKSGKFSKRYST
jgi:FkbM family methyltransferase